MFDKIVWQRKNRLLNKNKWTKKYEKTKNGFLVRCYRNMLSRVKGISPKRHLYLGKEILDKDIFYKWSLEDKNFNNLFEVWKKEIYPRKKTPSIDRIDNEKGYIIKNIRWVTFSENCKHTRRNDKQKTKNMGNR